MYLQILYINIICWLLWWRYGGGVVEVALWFGGVLTGFQPVHARLPIHADPQFSQGFMIFHRKAVYHNIDNYQIDHTHW